ncbi:MAG TPA: hypothetical protein VII47_10275, partial [Actinomycetota bacterium]
AHARARGAALREALLLAVATLRREEALEFLLALLRDGPAEDAAGALAALALHRGDDALRARVVEVASSRLEPRVQQALARLGADP